MTRTADQGERLVRRSGPGACASWRAAAAWRPGLPVVPSYALPHLRGQAPL